MLAAILKQTETLNIQDIEELLQRRWPETENVEYKAGLHRERDGRQDPWYTGGNISGPSKSKIFKELVAFANTSGGRLFLGIAETAERPPCASAIQPIPRCCELAQRLEQSIISSIDPPLTFLRVAGVPLQGDSGVVVAEVSRSYNGPHRSPDLQCYVRKGTNSVPITMREIHDIVMRFSRRQDEIRDRLAESGARFRQWVGVGTTHQNLSVGFRVTALPVGSPLHVDKVFSHREVSRTCNSVKGAWRQDGGKSLTQVFASPLDLSERPILGGTAWISSPSEDRAGKKVILRDGLIEVWFKWPWYQFQQGRHPRPILPLDWIIAASANVLASVDDFRRLAQSPGCEYGLELSLVATNGPAEIAVEIVQTRMGAFEESIGAPLETPTLLGPYSVGDRNAVLNLIVRDLLDASGIGRDWATLEVDWSSSAPS